MKNDQNFYSLEKHPLVLHWTTILRNKNTSSYNFRKAISVLCTMLFYIVSKNFVVGKKVIDTPVINNFTGAALDCKIVLVPILRAGLSMLNAFLDLVPKAEVNMIGIERCEKNFKARMYYMTKTVNLTNKIVVILDPMLATGVSARAAIVSINSKFKPKQLILASIITYNLTASSLIKECPNLKIYTCVCDPSLNEKNFIVPGLGDAGDRYFHT